MIEDCDIECPYCGESQAIAIDILAGEQEYTEDCVVCCQPITIYVVADSENGISTISAEPENG